MTCIRDGWVLSGNDGDEVLEAAWGDTPERTPEPGVLTPEMLTLLLPLLSLPLPFLPPLDPPPPQRPDPTKVFRQLRSTFRRHRRDVFVAIGGALVATVLARMRT